MKVLVGVWAFSVIVKIDGSFVVCSSSSDTDMETMTREFHQFVS